MSTGVAHGALTIAGSNACRFGKPRWSVDGDQGSSERRAGQLAALRAGDAVGVAQAALVVSGRECATGSWTEEVPTIAASGW